MSSIADRTIIDPAVQSPCPPLPHWNEAERLAALERYAILDTGRETAFDDVAALAADLLDAPIAVVNLIAADRQWFKAEVGIGTDTLPLDVSICRHAILQPGVFVVRDLTADPRFDGNPLIHVAGGLRFYAGALLETPDGLPLGTVCVLDTKARPEGLTGRQTRALAVLAAQTMARLELRRSEAMANVERVRAERHAQRLSLLSRASSLLLATDDPTRALPALFALIADDFRLSTGFHHACVDHTLKLAAAAGLTAEQNAVVATIAPGQTLCGCVAATSQPRHITGILACADTQFPTLRSLGIDSYFMATLLVGDELLGTLAFGRSDGAFSPGEREALGTLAAQLATAMHRCRAEHDLKASAGRLRHMNETLETQVIERTAERDRMWDTSPDLLVIIDFAGLVRRVNPAWTAILGLQPDALIGAQIDRLVHPDDVALVHKSLAVASAGPLPTVECRLRHNDGSDRWFSWVAAPHGAMIYATWRHITAEKAREAELALAQEALRQSQKMEAMGSLTGGVAHDFNNLLTPIVGALDMLQRGGFGGAREQRLLSGAVQSAERAKTLVQRLLAFARRQPLQPIAVDLAPLVRGMADLVASTTGPQIRVMVEAQDHLPRARADPNQLEMAILNLAVNARDAMPDGGTLRISVVQDQVEVPHRAGLVAGTYLKLSVADTGEGMDEATLKRAVEPFFSTKGIGKGTGLGLSMVHGVASQLGGALTISSARGLGTNIELWLPCSTAPHVAAVASEVHHVPVAACRTVLLVDDETLVRLCTADMLDELGYAVVEAASAEEALRLVDQGLHPDVLVTDHLMPGMSGTDLARALKHRRPDAKVLIVSGYAEADGVDQDLPRLTKPFRSADLAASLNALT